MKHNIKITIILLAMFIITQFIGLYVVNHYSPQKFINGEQTSVSAPNLPYGMRSPEIKEERDFYAFFPSLLIAFVIAISLLFLLTYFKAEFVMKLWFFVVVILALGIALTALIPKIPYSSIIALAIALPIAYLKVYKRNFLLHNITELFIYPGIAAVFVPILNVWTIIILLILISIYDAWAVWKSGIMQKMAKYQIKKLNIFSGFFVPYLNKKQREKINKMSDKDKEKLKTKKIKVNVAILGGGDVVFPIITAGIMLKTLGWIPAILVIAGATLGLLYLFFFAEKKKFYPAMPFITAGIFLGIILSYILV